MTAPALSQCRGCNASVRLNEDQVAAILRDYLKEHPGKLAAEDEYAARIAVCRDCPDLEYGTTCLHCGCVVAVMTRLADKHCPHPSGRRW